KPAISRDHHRLCVVSLMIWLRISLSHTALLLAMIGLVITTELLNTSIEWLVAKLHPEWDPKIGDVLDVAAAAVLIAAITAVAVGLLILGPPLWTVIESMVSKSGR
ncbi:MAG: diacylglycerol kinase, partial [Planctomycetota bacterium]